MIIKPFSLLGRFMYSKKIKHYENNYEKVKDENQTDKQWQEHMKKLFKRYAILQDQIDKSEYDDPQKVEKMAELQAFCNIEGNKLRYMEKLLSEATEIGYKNIFQEEYAENIMYFKRLQINEAVPKLLELIERANSVKLKKLKMWFYIDAILKLQALEELHGNEIIEAVEAIKKNGK